MGDALLAYIYDFLSVVFEDKTLKEKIKEIILYGSVAKKNYDKKSDLDLFFNVKEESEIDFIERSLKTILKSFEISAEKKWNIKGIKFPISYIVGSLENPTWENIREEIISSGITLYGAFKEMPKNIKHNYLIYYSLRDLKSKDKMKFIRKLFGYRLKKNGREYVQKGLLTSLGGIKLASNAILIPPDNILKVKNLFSKSRIKYKIIETWLRI